MTSKVVAGIDLMEREPQAGDWAVVRRGAAYRFIDHERAQIDSVKPKTVMAKVGPGRRLKRVSRDDLVLVADEAAAVRLCAQLESARAEAVRRERDAYDAYRTKVGKLYLAALRARASLIEEERS